MSVLSCNNKFNANMKYFISSCEVYNDEPVNEEDKDSRRGSTALERSISNNGVVKVHEVAKTWYELADEDEKLCISGITTYKWIEDESVAATHQLLIPYDSDFETILRVDIIIESRERKLKVMFSKFDLALDNY